MDKTWDERYWQLSLKANNPVEAYQEMTSKVEAEKDSPRIEDLPPEQQAWLRSTA